MNQPATGQEAKRASLFNTYIQRMRAFTPNARQYLISTAIFGVAMGIQDLLFNFYVLSMGYNQAVLGNLVTLRSATTLIAALPMGYLTDRLGRKAAFLAGNIGVGVSIALMVAFPSVPMFSAMNLLLGMAQSLSAVAMGPFLMENSGEKERTYLFSFASGMRVTAASVGQWLGGFMPGWFAGLLGVSAVSTLAYKSALSVLVIGVGLSSIPLLFISNARLAQTPRSVFAPFSYMRRDARGMSKLILPMLVTSVGAGMIMPFMNVFFRNVHHQSDSAIGVIFAWGSLAMGLGLLIAPILAEKFGKIQVVVASQAISIPFLVLLGFSPWFAPSLVAYYFRLTLMNMSGPVYSTFVMEKVDPQSRGMMASLTSMASNFGWAFSPTISGILQVRYGFQPAFAVTLVMYVASTAMYYFWFWHSQKAPQVAPACPKAESAAEEAYRS